MGQTLPPFPRPVREHWHLAPPVRLQLLQAPMQALTATPMQTEPSPGTITVSATNVATPATTNVVVLGYGCQYQGGFLYSVMTRLLIQVVSAVR